MKGYKVFNPDWTCQGFHYEVGETYELDGELELCVRGFHFCEKLVDCFKFYKFATDNKVAEVEALGNVVGDERKLCTNKIRIVRELSRYEVLRAVNTGRGCTGFGNSGGFNSGSNNSGSNNSGSFNSGRCNSGSFNSGRCNSGSNNSGSNNSGSFNSGRCNSGSFNSGRCNSGSFNSGRCNSGRCNSGSHNSGRCNSGSHNSGSNNSGDFNATDHSSGCFNTQLDKIQMFNRPTSWTLDDWRASEAHAILAMMPNGSKWVAAVDMTDEEKAKHPEADTTGGYLIEPDNAMRQEWWDGLSDSDKSTVKSLPNFDAEIFEQITGIKV